MRVLNTKSLVRFIYLIFSDITSCSPAFIFMGLPFALMTVWFALVFVYISFQQGEGSESLTGIPMRYIVKTAAPIGFILLLSAFVSTALRLYVYLYGDEALQELCLRTGIREACDTATRAEVSVQQIQYFRKPV